ncbi:MAG: hypothetical protein RLN82_09450 [Pseudomonadales bacterium]
MGLLITADGANALGQGLYIVEMAPHQVRLFGEPRQSLGSRSVILVNKVTYSSDTAMLSFEADDVLVLNLGAQSWALVVDASWGQEMTSPNAQPANYTLGPGDREFLSIVKELSADMQKAATNLLQSIRRASPGDLKRGQRRNFSNTPDNFWYVVVQPRSNDLSITVRGEVSTFIGESNLEVKADRPGYTRFKLSTEDEVEAALELIRRSRRKA